MKYRVKKSEPELNLAPMIDVVFLLLIFFIIASTLNLNEVKSNINLPETETVTARQQVEISVLISKDGKLYVNDREVTRDELPEILELLSGESQEREVSIYADKKVEFQKVITIMDIIKKQNINSISFALHQVMNPGGNK